MVLGVSIVGLLYITLDIWTVSYEYVVRLMVDGKIFSHIGLAPFSSAHIR